MLRTFNKWVKDENGFTIIELMIVVVIIGVLAAIAVPVYSNAAQESKISRAKGDLRTLESALSIYHAENNRYPATINRLVVEEYIKTVPKDPWENGEYYYDNETGIVYLARNNVNKLPGRLYSHSVFDD